MQKLNNLSFHHIGFAVRSARDSRASFEAMGADFFHVASDESRNLDFQFANWGGVVVELISPHNPELSCAVTNMVAKQPCMPYHICFETHDLREELKELKNMGFRQVGKVLTTDIYGYEATGVFLFNKGMGLVELIQECKTDE